ncbi:hypothetical protein FH972_023251 [Carpinus fangiana]|uniref:Uncharacterized protein n=1 Tax=Carpinus fangiana TaxID=176857 RepID=A0A5N6KUN4_9ROSI|nr:hypothetical protein FH972_023251 [Carpinus fangiana]
MASPIPQAGGATPWKVKRPYADQVENSHGKQYQNLCQFLREGFGSENRSSLPIVYAHDFWIADRNNGVFNIRQFSASAGRGQDQAHRSVWPDFSSAIRDRTDEVDIRIILSTCRSLAGVNEAYMDDMALACDLPPNFLCAHFDRLSRTTARTKDYDILLPSERSFLQLLNVGDCTLTAFIQHTAHGFLVVILSMGSSKSVRQGPFPFIEGFASHLQTMSQPPDQPPADLLYSFVRSMIIQAERIRRTLLRDFEARFRFDSAAKELNIAQRQRDGLRYSRDSLAEYVKLPPAVIGPPSLRLASLVAEYERLIEGLNFVVIDQQAFVQHIVAMKSIEEAVRGIQQADSVRRLTIIAFLFLPLNFATSFFGMNIKQLDTGTVNIGYFFLLAILLGLLSYVLTVSVKPMEASWAAHKRKVAAAAAADWTVYGKRSTLSFWSKWHWNALLGRKNPVPSKTAASEPRLQLTDYTQ